MQSIAWVGMLVSYSQESGLSQGIAQTFSGQRPCALCKVIQSADHDDSSQAQMPLASLRFEATPTHGWDIAHLTDRGVSEAVVFLPSVAGRPSAWLPKPHVPPPQL